MEKILSNKPLVHEVHTIEVPLAFAEMFAANPANFSKWVVGAKRAKGIGEMKVKELLDVRANASLDEEGLLLNVMMGKDEHSLLIKKSDLDKGLNFVLKEGEKFKIESVMKFQALDEKSCTAHVDVNLLEAKHKFHPITSFEIKYFFKKSLKNFVKACEESYHTMDSKEKTLEAQAFSFYLENMNAFKNLIAPLEKDLGPETVETVQQDLKALAHNNSEKFSQILTALMSLVSKDQLTDINKKIAECMKTNTSLVENLAGKSHAGALTELNSAAKLHLENLKYLVPALLKDVKSEKIVELEKMVTGLLQDSILGVESILEKTKDKIPPQHLKNFEAGIVSLLNKDLAVSKTAMDKITAGNPTLSLEEAKLVASIKEIIDKYAASVKSRDDKSYTSAVALFGKTLAQFKEDLIAASSKVTPESVENTKNIISAHTDDAFKAAENILKDATPENLAENKEKFNAKVKDILDRYTQAAKLIDPELSDDKIAALRNKIEETIKKEYESFTAEKK